MYPFIACLISGLICTIFGTKHCCQAIDSRRWPHTIGLITQSAIETYRSSPTQPEHHLRLRYTYSVRGREYRGYRIRYRPFWNILDRQYMDSFVERYPQGKSVEVFYSPNQPKIAILEPGFHWSTPLLLICGIIFLWAAYMLYFKL